MPRRKSTNIEVGKTTAETMRNAVRDVINGGFSVKAAAVKHNIPRTSLRRYVGKCQEKEEVIDWNSPILEGAPRLTPNYRINQVFSCEEEDILSDYFQTMTKLHHGMDPKCARKLAYDLAVINKKKMPDSWRENCTAGRLWFNGFMKRRRELSIRSAEATSLGRAMGFNKPVVEQFFGNLQQIYERYNLGPDQVYNVDETALTTVQETGKVLARKGQKQVGHITSSERGTLVTMCGCINAIGNNIPPLLVFPRKNFKDYMIKNGPPGAVGVATPSGWMTSEIFIQWLNHFVKHSKPSPEAPALLIMDNHETHISLGAIKFAKENNVILLTLPPHTSHRLQPLDKSVYFALKKFYSQSCRAWLLNNPGKRISIYDIADILGESYPLAFTPRNCVSGFRSTGIFPFNRNIFNDEDFMAASVTDLQEADHASQKNNNKVPNDSDEQMALNTPSTSSATLQNTTPEKHFVSPTALKPFPTAILNPNKKRQRKKKKTEILTNTPVIERLEEEEKMKEARKSSLHKQPGVKRKIANPLMCAPKTDRKQAKSKEWEESTSDSAPDIEMSDYDDEDLLSEQEKECKITGKDAAIAINSYILVKFVTKKTIKYYVGRVTEIMKNTNEVNVTFLRRHGNNFTYPDVSDAAIVPEDDVVLHLGQPDNVGGTNRTAHLFSFSINLSMYNVC